MRFTIDREEFLKGLSIASRAVASKAASPALLNLKLELNDLGLFITGSNIDLTIRTFIPFKLGEKEIIRNYKEGSILFNAKLITDIARKMEAQELIIDIVDTTIAVISDNRSKYNLICVRPEEYPQIDLEPSGTKVVFSKEEFDAIVSQTAFAASTKEQRPILTALNLEAFNGAMTITATDSARMARKVVSVPADVNVLANIPAKMMVEIDRLLEGTTEVNASFSDKKALFIFDKTTIATRLIAGDYPNTRNIVPKNTNYELEVNSLDFIKAIERANILSIDRENVVDLTMSEEGVEISAKSLKAGSAIEKIEKFKFEGSNLRVSFNSEFVLAAIKALNCEDVTFLFVGEMKPFVVKNNADDSITQIVTPVRTY